MQPLGGAVFVLDGILIGAGDVRYLALAMAGATLCFVPCAILVLTTGAGLIALWSALFVFMLNTAVATAVSAVSVVPAIQSRRDPGVPG